VFEIKGFFDQISGSKGFGCGQGGVWLWTKRRLVVEEKDQTSS